MLTIGRWCSKCAALVWHSLMVLFGLARAWFGYTRGGKGGTDGMDTFFTIVDRGQLLLE